MVVVVFVGVVGVVLRCLPSIEDESWEGKEDAEVTHLQWKMLDEEKSVE